MANCYMLKRIFRKCIEYIDTDYCYSVNSLARLEEIVSRDRLTKYLQFSSSDLYTALELHDWNCLLGGAMHPAIQYFEVVLRNACDRELGLLYGRADWFNCFPDPSIERRFKYLVSERNKVKERLIADSRDPNNPPCVVAGLGFGFWTSLFTRRVERDFWKRGLVKVFPYKPSGIDRDEISRALNQVKDLRNRIAHHEPIFHRNLEAANQVIAELTSFISPEATKVLRSRRYIQSAARKRPWLSQNDVRKLNSSIEADKWQIG